MNILITAATPTELNLLQTKLKTSTVRHTVRLAVTGIGTTLTAYHLTKLLTAQPYDLVLNIGIAGSFDCSLQLGNVVAVSDETFADWGVFSPAGFSTVFEERLVEPNHFPFTNGLLHCPYVSHYQLSNIPHVSAITVNAASGQTEQIAALNRKFLAQIESMEGAAFFYVCLNEQIPFLEIRSISNRVEPRNKAVWDIPLALTNLSEYVYSFLNQL